MQSEEGNSKQNVVIKKERVERGNSREEERKGRRLAKKSTKIDMRAKLERSRQSARECRARKKLRYQYLEELVASRERAVIMLRQELEMYKQWSKLIDEGHIPEAAFKLLEEKPEDQEIKTEPLSD